MKYTLLCCTAAAALLASCAPTMTGPVTGRVVSSQTGEEGQISFTRGTLQPRLNGAYAEDNAIISLGGQTYTGRTVFINSAAAPASAPSWGMDFNFGGGNFGRGDHWDNNFFGWGSHFDTARTTPTRVGNLIARTSATTSTPAQVLTCTITADVNEHGVGECKDSKGNTYALQF